MPNLVLINCIHNLFKSHVCKIDNSIYPHFAKETQAPKGFLARRKMYLNGTSSQPQSDDFRVCAVSTPQ